MGWKISDLQPASLPLNGTDLLEVAQPGGSRGVRVMDLVPGYDGDSLQAILSDKDDPTKGVAIVGRAKRQLKSRAELKTISGSYDGETAETQTYYGLSVLPYAQFDQGGASWVWSGTSTAADSPIVCRPNAISVGSPGRWLMVITNGVSFRQAGARGDGVTDDTDAIQSLIDCNPGTLDLAGVKPTPTWPIRTGEGTFIVGNGATSRLLVAKNGIRIIGSGRGSSYIQATGSKKIAEVIRFREAYWCELSGVTVHGGLPFSPTLSETYGADVGVVFDQVAYFESENLCVEGTRISAFDVTHLWESHFIDLSHLNFGWFGTSTRKSCGWNFTQERKESTFFPGGESNQIYVDKYSYNGVGSILRTDVPVFNFKVGMLIGEQRTAYADLVAMRQELFFLSVFSSGIEIAQGYIYAHEHPYQFNATMINAANAGNGCKFKLNIYQQRTLSGHYLQCPTIVTSTSVYPIHLDLTIQDVGGETTTLVNTPNPLSGGTTGTIVYRTDLATKKLPTMFAGGADRRFTGDVLFWAGDFTTDRLQRFKYSPWETEYWSPSMGAALYPVSKVVARGSFNGSTLAIAGQRNLRATTPIVRVSAGIWRVYFDVQMPNTGYSVSLIANEANEGDKMSLRAKAVDYFEFQNKTGAATYGDATIIDFTVTL